MFNDHGVEVRGAGRVLIDLCVTVAAMCCRIAIAFNCDENQSTHFSSTHTQGALRSTGYKNRLPNVLTTCAATM